MGADPGQDPYRMQPARSTSKAPWAIAIIAMLVAAGALGYLFVHREESRVALREAKDDAAGLKRKVEELANKAAALEDEKKKEAEEAKRLADQIASQGASAQNTQKVIADLRTKLDAKDAEVSGDADKITVNVVDRILFKSGEADLSPKGKDVLSKVGTIIKTLKDKMIMIGGHTDDVPIHNERFASNWELSAARAVTVVRYLAESAGVESERLIAAGYSQYHPRKRRERAKNRRIEILLTPRVEVKKQKLPKT